MMHIARSSIMLVSKRRVSGVHPNHRFALCICLYIPLPCAERQGGAQSDYRVLEGDINGFSLAEGSFASFSVCFMFLYDQYWS